MAQNNLPAPSVAVGKSLVNKFAERYSIDADKLLPILKATAFRLQKPKNADAPPEVSNEQMAALLVVADQYKLNPFTKEVYAFPDKGKGIVPIVSVDGWSRIANEHPMFDGIEFRSAEKSISMDDDAKPCPEWIEAIIYRKDRTRATIVREYLDECYKPATNGQYGKVAGPWQSHTKRFLRHRAFVQCARLAFGFAGIYEEDEGRAMAWGTGSTIDITPSETAYDTAPFNESISAHGISPDDPDLTEFVRQAAELNRSPLDKVKVEAAADIEGFLSGFKAWVEKRQAKADAAPKTEKKAPPKTEKEEPQAQPEHAAESPMVECPNTGEMVSRTGECQTCKKREIDCPHWA